jgi:hypothetical protein
MNGIFFFLFILSPLISSYHSFSSKKTAQMTRLNTKLRSRGSLGTDILVRPDDEDSPEFKEYLRQLMILTANRAKTGYSAPSSASADVYIAKLNRIKIERMRLRELGLPDDAVDTSYRPEDYKAAAYVIIHLFNVLLCYITIYYPIILYFFLIFLYL